MKIIKRTIVTLLVIILTGYVFRGWIYRYFVTYKPVEKRVSYLAVNEKFISFIEEETTNKKQMDIEEIIELGLSITSKQLSFSTSKNHNDPNKLIETKTANCIGYATFFSASCNYLLKKYNLDSQWIAIPYKGQLYLFGANVHNYFKSPFFKAHDFVVIENRVTRAVLAVDPSVNDYLHIDFITFNND